MIANSIAGAVRALLIAFAFVALLAPAQAQQPSANAVALAKEIITLKGSAHMFDSVVPNLGRQDEGDAAADQSNRSARI